MVGIHTDIVIFEVEGILTKLDVLELIFVEVWPTPESSVDHMGEAFPPSNL